MTHGWKAVIDSTDPHAQAPFWAAALSIDSTDPHAQAAFRAAAPGHVVADNRVLIERR